MELIQRDDCLAVLTRYLHEVAHGAGRIVLVHGEAGIGKTSLLRHFSQQHHGAVRVLWGGCEALFTPHPLAPLHDIARQIGQAFVDAVADARDRIVIFNLILDELRRSSTPTMLIFEDVHWADEATLDLIKHLGRRLQTLPVMLVLSYRDDEIGPRHPLQLVIGDLPVQIVGHVQVAALDADAVAALASSTGKQAQKLYEVTGGNPFYVTEALAVSGGEIPQSVRDAVLARLGRLSPSSRAVADLTALSPGKTERWILEGILDVDESALQECLTAGMVVVGDEALAFRHDIARRSVEESLSFSVRRRLHSQILDQFKKNPGAHISNTRWVHHADGTSDGAVVLQYAPKAAQEAADNGAHREAALHYATALRYAQNLDADAKANLYDRLSYEWYLTDRIADAIHAGEAALELWRLAKNLLKQGDALRWVSRLHWFNAQTARAISCGDLAISTLETLPVGRELAMAYANRSQLYYLAGDVAQTIKFGNRALRIAEQLGDTEVELHALNNIGSARFFDDPESGRVDLERSLALSLANNYEDHVSRAFTNLAYHSVQIRDYNRARDYLARGIAYCEERDLDSRVRFLHLHSAEICLAQGEWNRAAQLAEAALLKTTIVAPAMRIQALTLLGSIQSRRGSAGAQAALDEACSLAATTLEVQRIGRVAAARAEAAWLRGDTKALVAEASGAYALTAQQQHPWIRGELAFWLWRGEAMSEMPDDIAEPFALQMAGNWSAAAQAWEKLGCPYQQALALMDSSDAAALRKAQAILERLGAYPTLVALRRSLHERDLSLDIGFASLPHFALLTDEALELDLSDPEQRRLGDYELLEHIGAGGMGTVYRARQVSLDREVAVKLLAAGAWASRQFVDSFRYEAQNAARLQHPHIVTIYEVGRDEDLHYYSMRLVRGENLAAVLHRQGRFDAREAAALMIHVAQAIDYAHALGVLHLDLKPANILIDEQAVPHVADFGLARRLEQELADNDTLCGTPNYMAPEQAAGGMQLTTPATDIWGLGAVLYELVSGEPPFVGRTRQETLEQVREGRVRPLGKIVVAVPLDLQAIIARCLNKGSAERYAKAGELARDLEAFVNGRPVAVRPRNPLQRFAYWLRREPVLAAMAAAAAITMTLLAAMALLQ